VLSKVNNPARCSVIILFLSILVSSCVWTAEQAREQEENAVSLLSESAYWIIQEGIGQYYKEGNNFSSIYNYVTDKGPNFYFTDFHNSMDRYLEWTAIHKYPAVSNIYCFTRIHRNRKVYEYWVFHIGSGRRDFKNWQIRFVITEAVGMKSKRNIIYDSDKFVSSYNINSKVLIFFPIEQVFSVSEIEPWEFKESFEGTEYEGMRPGDTRRISWLLKPFSGENITHKKRQDATDFILNFYKNVKEENVGALKSSLEDRGWWDRVGPYMWSRRKRHTPTQRIEIKRIMTSQDVENVIYIELDEWIKSDKSSERLIHLYYILTYSKKGKLKLSEFWSYSFQEWPVRSTDR